MNIRLRKIKSQEITTQNNQQEEEEKPELSAEFTAVNVAFYLLFFTSFLTRVWRIQQPGQVVFDKVHFGKFASLQLSLVE
jgi:dolichyl-phosphate-mannose-protein mannosyltransferase